MLATHHRVSGMNFILDGYVVPAIIQDARTEAESQFIANAPVETNTQPPSPNTDIKFWEDEQDVDEPSTPPKDVNSDQQAMPLPQQQIPPTSNPANLYSRKSKSLQVNIQDPPSEELIQHVVEAFNTPLPSSSGQSLLQKKGPLSPSTSTQEGIPQEELSPPRERQTKMKQDKRPKKKPQG